MTHSRCTIMVIEKQKQNHEEQTLRGTITFPTGRVCHGFSERMKYSNQDCLSIVHDLHPKSYFCVSLQASHSSRDAFLRPISRQCRRTVGMLVADVLPCKYACAVPRL